MVINRSNPVPQSWLGKEVLVTGGSGFVGTWLSRSLTDKGAHVTKLVRVRSQAREVICDDAGPKVAIVRGSVEDSDFVCGVLKKTRFDAVFHLASTNDNRGLVEPASDVFDANILGAWNLLSGVQKFLSPQCTIVLASSSELDRLKTQKRGKIGANWTSIHPYHAAKKCTEAIGEMFFEQYGLKLASIRLPNVFGSGDHNASRIVPSIISALIREEAPRLNSTDDVARRYVYVEDVVDALLTVAEHLSAGRAEDCRFGFLPNPALTPVTLLKVIKEEFYGEPAGSSKLLELNGSAVKDNEWDTLSKIEEIGWKEKIGIRLGLKMTINWFQENEPAA